jgi:hypothetical protein
MSNAMWRTTPLHHGDPATVGQYTLLGRLGSGGMGIVFLAEDRDGRPVAVKMVHPHLAGDNEFRRRFRSEVEGARRVPPFCTAELLDADPDAPQPYLVVEYVDGPSLEEVIDLHGPLTTSNLHALAVGVATALTVIHEAGIIHRDLKPANVLLSPGSPKVIDFGIARALDATSQHTRTGHMVGTVAYMAPERLDSEGVTPLTPAADIFAWGCVVAFAGTGRAPFNADTPAATAIRILTQPPRLDGLTGPLRRLVELCLVTDPRARPTARQLLDMLLGSGHHSTSLANVPLPALPAPEPATTVLRHPAHPAPPAPRSVPPRPGARPARRSRRVVIGALAGAVVFILLAGAGAVAIAAAVLNDETSTSDAFDSEAADPTDETGTPSAFTLPKGKPFIVDALTSDGQWTASEIVGEEESHCGVTDGALRVQRATPGTYVCDGPKKEISGDHTVAVTARMEKPGTCVGVWLYFSEPSSYELRACETSWQLTANVNGGSYAVRRIDTAEDPLPIGEPIRLQVLVRDDVVSFGHDGVRVGEAPLPESEISRGRDLLGLVNDPDDDTAPYAASFNDFEVSRLTG